MKAIKRLVEADALKMEIIPNPKVLIGYFSSDIMYFLIFLVGVQDVILCVSCLTNIFSCEISHKIYEFLGS